MPQQILILHSKDAENKCAAITTQDSAFTNTKAGVEPTALIPKRHKLSVGDKKLSSAPAPEQVPELQLFANLAVEEGAPPLSYWGGLYDQLKKVGCELDFPEIEERVFNCLVLGSVAMGKAENGRLLSFGPPPLLFIGTGEIEARVAAEVKRVAMHPVLLPHRTKITTALCMT